MTRSALLPGAAALAILIAGVVAAEEVRFALGDEHPWNRLHRLLYVRALPNGKTYSYEGLECCWGARACSCSRGRRTARPSPCSTSCCGPTPTGSSRTRCALLQRDLWYVLDKTADPPYPEGEQRQPQRRELQKRLAQVMRRLELSPKEIERCSTCWRTTGCGRRSFSGGSQSRRAALRAAAKRGRCSRRSAAGGRVVLAEAGRVEDHRPHRELLRLRQVAAGTRFLVLLQQQRHLAVGVVVSTPRACSCSSVPAAVAAGRQVPRRGRRRGRRLRASLPPRGR